MVATGLRKKQQHKERGYKVIWISMAMLFLVNLFAGIYLFEITKLNYEICLLNLDNVTSGYYSTVYPTFDTTIIGIILASFNAAFAIIVNAQMRKKAINNNFEYAEQMLDKWADRYGMDYVATIIQSFLQTNSNN